ncbi:flagellar hook-basal body complex protein FliE [Alicyclobacillus sp. TC]|uniref:flagellar hook-basal body complex protein FliE n=1 Tax=Alicyclobacillus sp. TC TaxID=2606450 RepID=UPI0019349C72|nr:flagellar hook-basal body complex protein FliE [Alicyclobacillus sp. TC]QRF23724.1 flagellar hook-basal body complex protein FliE [Alicyclobacillus sp. TC]
MTVNPVFGLSQIIPSLQTSSKSSAHHTSGENFLQYLQNALGQVNQLSQNADQTAIDYAEGGNISIDQVMVAEQKASIALDALVQVNNRVVNAYNTVMNMQV